MTFALEDGQLAERVVNISLVLGVLAFLIGLALLLIDWVSERQLRLLAKKATKEVEAGGAGAQGIALPGIGESLNALANLAKAMKALDRSGRLLIFSLVFFAIAAIGAFTES